MSGLTLQPAQVIRLAEIAGLDPREMSRSA
jgi:hypothetical protein